MAAAATLGQLAENDLDILEAAAGELAAGDFGADAALTAPHVGQVNEVVLRVTGMQRDIEQPALADGGDLRQAGNRLRIQLAVLADDPQPARAFRDQHPAIGQEREAPGMLEPLDQPHDAKSVLFAGDCLCAGGRGAQGESGTNQRCGVRSSEEFHEY